MKIYFKILNFIMIAFSLYLFGTGVKAADLSWVAQQYKSNRTLMYKIAQYIDFYSSDKCISFIPQGSGKTLYGKNVPVFESIACPALRYINSMSKTKPVNIMEIAAGCGNFTWMIPFAIEESYLKNSKIYINDIGEAALKENQKRRNVLYSEFGVQHLENLFVQEAGDCTTLMKSYPELLHKITCITVFNVQHFLNPVQDQMLYENLKCFLASEGCAFLCAQSFIFNMGDSYCQFYQNEKKKEHNIPHLLPLKCLVSKMKVI